MFNANSCQMQNYSDDDITFFIGIYRDRVRAEGALARLREHFPDARVIARSDGDKDPKNRKLPERFDVDYREEERLYPIENGGAMISRMLELYLEQPTRYLLKIDTDTAAYRRFHFLPREKGVFGKVQNSKQGCISVQGGFTGLTEETARCILDSGVLDDDRLKDPISYRLESAYFDRMAYRVERTGLCGFDWIVGWVAHKLELPLISFSEVHCKWLPKHNVKNDDLKFAMTHPVYFDGVNTV